MTTMTMIWWKNLIFSNMTWKSNEHWHIRLNLLRSKHFIGSLSSAEKGNWVEALNFQWKPNNLISKHFHNLRTISLIYFTPHPTKRSTRQSFKTMCIKEREEKLVIKTPDGKISTTLSAGKKIASAGGLKPCWVAGRAHTGGWEDWKGFVSRSNNQQQK